MTFKTRNSTYEMNPDAKKIRRVAGVNPPTNRQGADGVWQSYHALAVEPGAPAVITWRIDDSEDGPIARMTVTGPVVSVHDGPA